MTPVQRILPNAYSDQLILPRKARNGGFLPSARIVSNTLTTNDAERESRVNTALLMAVGQFIDHDVTHTPMRSKLKTTSPRTKNTEVHTWLHINPYSKSWRFGAD